MEEKQPGDDLLLSIVYKNVLKVIANPRYVDNNQVITYQPNFSRPSSSKPQHDDNNKIIYVNNGSDEGNGISFLDYKEVAVEKQTKHVENVLIGKR